MASDARVRLWGRVIGAVSWLADPDVGVFQYAPEFVTSGIQLAPLTMPLAEFPYEFPGLPQAAFHGLPGLVADSLPDRFGHAVIDAWLAARGRAPGSMNPVERLCYVGKRGMGALEYEPALPERPTGSDPVDVADLVALAGRVLDRRAGLAGALDGKDDAAAMRDILRVGTSAGGARAKAVLAWNPATGEFRSGQADAPAGFEPWLLKFDGVRGSGDRGLDDPQGWGRIEYAYHRMATAAGITMMPCRLHQENGRAHFMTRRFDRTEAGGKLHLQSLGAMAHLDYNQPGAHSYEQALQAMRRLELPRDDLAQQVRRAMFNVLARNRDDHVKNIAFLMDREGRWRLSPAFDLVYAWHPDNPWMSRHQMSIGGKRDGLGRDDLLALATFADVKRPPAGAMLAEVLAAVARWPEFAADAGVEEERSEAVGRALGTLADDAS
jgi:serine/threonine-protein kinase HipA